jgi:tetratricopeptide (TPR) repeat protein
VAGSFDTAVLRLRSGAITHQCRPHSILRCQKDTAPARDEVMDLVGNCKLFLKLYYKPLSAMSGIIDRGSWLLGAVCAVAVAALLQFSVTSYIYSTYEAPPVRPAHPSRSFAENRAAGASGLLRISKDDTGGIARENQGSGDASQGDEDSGDDEYQDEQPVPRQQQFPLIGRLAFWFVSFSSLSVLTSALGLALLYVPATILVIVLLGQPGSFGVVFRRDYGSLLTCTLMAWSAAHLPVALAGFALASVKVSPSALLVIWLAGKVYFAVLVVCALRTLFGAGYGKAIATVSLSWVAVLLEPILLSTRLLFYLASPFVLFYLYAYLRGGIGDLGHSVSRRQSYRRHLEAATVNPRDAEAHYQLGLIYQQRHQYTEAIERFKRAVEIDPREIDAQYQLGIIARSQGRLPEAIDYFSAVVALNDKHALSEIWREIGATYLAAGMLDEAKSALDRFIERRPYDAEGLYLLGETLRQLGKTPGAREMFVRCVEAANTTPYYRRGEVRKWARLAQKQARTLGASAPSAAV